MSYRVYVPLIHDDYFTLCVLECARALTSYSGRASLPCKQSPRKGPQPGASFPRDYRFGELSSLGDMKSVHDDRFGRRGLP